jgi:AraC family transcriptional regulator
MELNEAKDFGTEKGGNPSADYCCHCYQNGGFTDKQTFEEAVENNIPWWKEDGDKSDDDARKRIMEVFPTLKRWKTVDLKKA